MRLLVLLAFLLATARAADRDAFNFPTATADQLTQEKALAKQETPSFTDGAAGVRGQRPPYDNPPGTLEKLDSSGDSGFPSFSSFALALLFIILLPVFLCVCCQLCWRLCCWYTTRSFRKRLQRVATEEGGDEQGGNILLTILGNILSGRDEKPDVEMCVVDDNHRRLSASSSHSNLDGPQPVHEDNRSEKEVPDISPK